MSTLLSSNRIKAMALLSVVAIGISLLALSLASADEPLTPSRTEAPQAVDSSSNYMPVQGRLTNASGQPVSGPITLTFRLYDVASGGTALCSYHAVPTARDGLFNTYMNIGGCPIDGRQLYLGIQVNDDAEMSPRSFIDNVAYAASLRPGAVISGTGDLATLNLENWHPAGRGLRAYAMSSAGENYGVVGASRSPAGYGGYFYNNGGGTGLYASSGTGVALLVTGTGTIKSAAPSHLWISGSGLRPFLQSDSTVVDMDTVGGAMIRRGATAGNKNVMLPIAVPGTLYGQNVRVSAMDIYWSGQTEFDGISVVVLRRQTGVCSGAACFQTIVHDPTDRTCVAATNPTGCVETFNLTANNVLSADSGVLYLTLELSFSGASTWIDIGGVRLTLEHD